MNLSKDISDIYEIIIRKQMFSVLCKNGFVYIASSDDLESTQEYIPLTKIMGMHFLQYTPCLCWPYLEEQID